MLSMLSMAWAALPVPLKTKYAAMLAAKLEQHGTHVWLVNTGWSAGGCGGRALGQAAYLPGGAWCSCVLGSPRQPQPRSWSPASCRYGVGRRISLEHTRAIVAAIHSGEEGCRPPPYIHTAA